MLLPQNSTNWGAQRLARAQNGLPLSAAAPQTLRASEPGQLPQLSATAVSDHREDNHAHDSS
jgi:hypothetical protein